MKLIIVSGQSGSGKSIALNTFEDLGWFCVDNLPVGLLASFARQLTDSSHPSQENAAVGIDARNNPQDLEQFSATLDDLRGRGIVCEILFLTTEKDELLKRYSETRRKHPLSDRSTSLADAIERELELLDPIARTADLRVDTTRTNQHQLRGLLRERVSGSEQQKLSVLVQSFGFKHGVPGDADFVFDIRCLPNPHWDKRLRPLTGLDEAVVDFLREQPLVTEMYEHIHGFLQTWIPRFRAENRSYLTVAIGCTGGQHRSVYMTQRLAESLAAVCPNVLTRHRELA